MIYVLLRRSPPPPALAVADLLFSSLVGLGRTGILETPKGLSMSSKVGAGHVAPTTYTSRKWRLHRLAALAHFLALMRSKRAARLHPRISVLSRPPQKLVHPVEGNDSDRPDKVVFQHCIQIPRLLVA